MIDATEHLGLAGAAAARFAVREGVPIEDSEAFADACVALVKSAIAFDPQRGCQFSTLASRACCNEMVNGLRRRTGWRKSGRSECRFDSLGERDPICPDSDYRDPADIARDVRAAIGQLPERSRLIMLRRLDGEILRDIAADLGLSCQRTHQIWQQSLASLRKLLKEYEA